MKILLAIDGSPCSELAVEEVARRPWPEGTAVRVLTVIEPAVIAVQEAVVLPQSYYDELERRAHEDLDYAVARLRQEATTKLAVEPVACTGIPKRVIIDEAEAWGADLVVLGSHGRGWVGRFLLGSVSQAVAAHTKCSVEIVRCRKAEGAVKQES